MGSDSLKGVVFLHPRSVGGHCMPRERSGRGLCPSSHPSVTGRVQGKLLPESHLEGRGRTHLFYSIPCRQLKDQIWEKKVQIKLFDRVDAL